MIIAVTFDGVATVKDSKVQWVPGAREAMAALRAAGHTLLLYEPRGRNGEQARNLHLDHPGLFDRFHVGVTLPGADMYMDPRALRVGGGRGALSWDEVAATYGAAAAKKPL